MKVIYNGELVSLEDSRCSSSGWLAGTGIFETIRTTNGKPWALSRHMRRAVNSSMKAKVALPSEELIRNCVASILEAEFRETGLLRISFDTTGDWAAVHLNYREERNEAKIRIHPEVLLKEGVPIKSYPYNHRLEILERARNAGFDEAIVVNSEGNICEGAVSNLILRVSGQWLTPPLSDGVLPGVMRALVIENFDVSVRSIAATQISDVESAFLLSSLRIAQPISSIENRELSRSPEFRREIQAMALRTSVG